MVRASPTFSPANRAAAFYVLRLRSVTCVMSLRSASSTPRVRLRLGAFVLTVPPSPLNDCRANGETAVHTGVNILESDCACPLWR
jgi:hypothetical protein